MLSYEKRDIVNKFENRQEHHQYRGQPRKKEADHRMRRQLLVYTAGAVYYTASFGGSRNRIVNQSHV